MPHAGRSAPIAVVAGEASGDQLGGALIEALHERRPDLEFVGIGGEAMRAAGMDTWWDCSELAVMGLAEVTRHLPRLLRLRNELRAKLLAARPALYVGIDAPDFNLRIEHWLRLRGHRTVHYVSPTVWAWRPGRVKKIARSADLVLCLFPFEPAFYVDHGVDATYVGHPLADRVPLEVPREPARAALGLEPDATWVGLLPGSREGEVGRLAAPMLDAAARLRQRDPGLRFVTALAAPRLKPAWDEAAAAHPDLDVVVIDGRAREVMAACDVLACASGTATLEAMLVNRPLVMAYRVAPTTYHVARGLKLMKTDRFALPNILAGETLVPELIQDEATGERLARELGHWLHDADDRQRLARRFDRLHRELRQDAAHRAAAAVLNRLDAG